MDLLLRALHDWLDKGSHCGRLLADLEDSQPVASATSALEPLKYKRVDAQHPHVRCRREPLRYKIIEMTIDGRALKPFQTIYD